MEGISVGAFKVKETSKGFVFHLVAGNGEIIGISESYTAKSSCVKGVESVRKNAAAKVEDLTEGESATNPKFELFKDKKGQFRFHLKASNGEIILSSEGYSSKEACKKGIASVHKNAANAKVTEE